MRTPLAKPEPMIRVLPAAVVGDGPWTPELFVRVDIPPRAGGQREVVEVNIDVAGVGSTRNAVGQDVVDIRAEAPPMAPGASADVRVTVAFVAAEQVERSSTETTVGIVDPRPPAPPLPPPVLNFTSRPDATGTATALVQLPRAPGVAAYFVDTAHEADLIGASGLSPPANATRDERAQFWLGQSRHRLAPAFYRLTSAPVPVHNPAFPHDLPGDLAELVAFRLVPLGANNASPDSRDCGLTFFAVPRDLAPPPPALLLDRGGPQLVLEVRAARGAVRAADVRIRAVTDADSDPRTGRVIVTGVLQNGTARIPVPAAAPAQPAMYVAEVRGETRGRRDSRTRTLECALQPRPRLISYSHACRFQHPKRGESAPGPIGVSRYVQVPIALGVAVNPQMRVSAGRAGTVMWAGPRRVSQSRGSSRVFGQHRRRTWRRA
jgi:hypothetical protein